jgi:hypothetical protein
LIFNQLKFYIMKKIVLSIVGVAVIGIAAMNVNLALQGEKGTNLTLAGLFSMADNESGTEDDEKNFNAYVECNDDYSCSCRACIKGVVDCSPTCPCCP